LSLSSLFSETVSIWRSRPAVVTIDASDFPDVSEAPPDARRLIRDRRYCRVLSKASGMPFDELSRELAWKALEHEMALVPGGEVCLASQAVDSSEPFSRGGDLITVEPLYLDRNCVTNRDYARFVQADGYSDPQFWPGDILPSLLQFLDRSGRPGPKHWTDGAPPADKLDHPVVGVCWFEANAFATWAGKRLPSTEQWQRAGTWPKSQTCSLSESRYPWGNAFDPSKANTWASRVGGTVAVTEYRCGNTPNGVRQLIGNVWEWVDTQFSPATVHGDGVLLEEAMAEIRGAAFDTYFPSQATCQFRTGQPLMHRGANVGFRCCISSAALTAPADPAFPNPEKNASPA
jgi:iron(II)-dependent oxidoreductase